MRSGLCRWRWSRAEDVITNADSSVEVLADPLEFDTVCAVLKHHGFRPRPRKSRSAPDDPGVVGRDRGVDGAFCSRRSKELDEYGTFIRMSRYRTMVWRAI